MKVKSNVRAGLLVATTTTGGSQRCSGVIAYA
jgi:hypothetical protein